MSQAYSTGRTHSRPPVITTRPLRLRVVGRSYLPALTRRAIMTPGPNDITPVPLNGSDIALVSRAFTL